MTNSKDIDKILQELKVKKGTDSAPPKGTVDSKKLQEIIKAETASKTAPAQPQASPVAITENRTVTAGVSQNTAHEIESEFLSKLAVALKENPAVSDLVEDQPVILEDKAGKNPTNVTAATYVDDKFVDFFTQSIAVPKPEPKRATSEIVVKRKKSGFFKKKYITDSLSLSIPQEEIDKRQQKVAKPSTQEFAKNFIGSAVSAMKPETTEIEKPVVTPKAKTPAAEKTATKQEYKFVPEAKNFEGTIALDKPDTVQTAKPVPKETPKDAESILKALTAKKAAHQQIVAVKPEPAAETVKPETVAEETAYIPDVSDTTPAENTPAFEETGYIPSVSSQQEEKPVKVVAKDADTEEVKQITGDITQMFAHLENIADNSETAEVEVAHAEAEEEDEEVFQPLGDENDYITSQFSDDPKEIYDELRNFRFTLCVRVGISAMCALVLFWLNFAAANGWPVPAFISPVAQPVMFYLTALVFFAIAVIGFLPTVANGVTGFVKGATPDSFLVVPAVLSFVQLNVAMLRSQQINPENVTIFAGFTVAAFGFNALGKIISAGTILRNLELAEVPEGINAGYILKDSEDVKRLARSLEEKNPQILVSRRTGYISNFISGGFSAHKSEKHSRILAIAGLAVAVICFAMTMVLNGNWTNALFAACGASVFMLPLSHSLISSVPAAMMQNALNKVGALVNGWQGIYQLSDASHVSFDAKHLFPKGCVVLHGIKTFEKERLDLAILYAASIAVEKCDNLRSVFLNVIDNKMDMLYPLESCEYKVGQGYVAWIEKNRVIMGNRTIMEEYNVAMPPLSMETRYISEGKKPIYLSVNGKLFGMFVVSYHPDEAVKENLMHLVEQGKSVILQSNDFSIDSQLLEIVYGLPADTVQVLNKNETALLLNYTAYSENTDCSMAHLDSLHSLSAGFFGADSAKRAAATCSLVQIISVVIGAVLAVVFTFSQTIWEIPLVSVLLLGLGWLGLNLMRALATKYL